jgi:hypothetical protein
MLAADFLGGLQTQAAAVGSAAVPSDDQISREDSAVGTTRDRSACLQSRLELLARRDELIGLEGELSEALGRARELESELERYRYAVGELERFRRSAVWRLYEPYARFRGVVGRVLRATRARFG